MKAWYRVTSPEGYVALELADSEWEARRKAGKRPGYTPAEALRVEFYAEYHPPVSAPPAGWENIFKEGQGK